MASEDLHPNDGHCFPAVSGLCCSLGPFKGELVFQEILGMSGICWRRWRVWKDAPPGTSAGELVKGSWNIWNIPIVDSG